MNWTEITPEQIREAENWWNSRTRAERERDYPRPVYSAGFFACGWRVFSGRERAEIAAVLLGAKPERKPVDTVPAFILGDAIHQFQERIRRR